MGAGTGTDGKGDYKYQSEIAAMVGWVLALLCFIVILARGLLLTALQMFVFGEVQDPLPETTRLVEDIVRGQIIEIVRSSLVPDVRPLTRLGDSRPPSHSSSRLPLPLARRPHLPHSG